MRSQEEEIAKALASGSTLKQPEMEDQGVIQKVPVLKDVETVEDKPATLSSEDSGTVGLSSDELTHSLAKDPNETPH